MEIGEADDLQKRTREKGKRGQIKKRQ